MNIAERAFSLLYPEKMLDYEASIKYSHKFNDYNANVRIRGSQLMFHLSRKWKEIDDDIRIGLIQELLVKIIKDRRNTINMDLYRKFIKNLHVSVPKVQSDKTLSESFDRINEGFFNGMMEKPNLSWGARTMSKLGHYSFHTDTIEVSGVFKNADKGLLDMVMYHEMLHKELKFHSTPGRSHYHTPEFRRREKQFADYEENERKLKRFLAKCRIKSWFFW